MSIAQYPDIIRVEIDSEVKSIVPEYLENRKKECELISRLLEAEAFSEIRKLGHRMKGTGGSYGFDDISEIGEVIEEAALATDKEAISKSLRQLTSYLERVVVEYV
jgi:HPt (histidine-containing phosphotransfer) domain-containing protein